MRLFLSRSLCVAAIAVWATDGAAQPSDREHGRFVEQWAICFHGNETTSARIPQCDAALAYRHLVDKDRARLLAQRAALVQWGLLTGQKPIGIPSEKVDSSPGISGGKICRGPCSYCDTRTGTCLDERAQSSIDIPEGKSCPGACSNCDTRTGVCVSADGNTPLQEDKASFREKNTSALFDRINYDSPGGGAVFVLLIIAACSVWMVYLMYQARRRPVAIENTQAEVPSRATDRPSEAASDQQARTFESSLETFVPGKVPPNVGNDSQVSAVLGKQPESCNLIEPPSQPMSLKLKRSQRSSVMGKIIFVLDARIGLNAEEHTLVKKHRLGGFVVYDSKARKKHGEATQAHLETTKEHPSLFDGPAAQFLGLGKTLFRIGRASVSATMAALSLRITVDSLIRGVHVECDSMDELLGAEKAIREATGNLKGYLEEAVTFDGREEIVEL